MKNIFLIFVILQLSALTAFSQTNWVVQNSGTFENINAIFTIDGFNVWAVGNNGKILKTSDCGVNWISLPAPAATNLSCVYFVNNNTGFVGGQDSKIYKTTNGGNSFSTISTPGNYAIKSISFAGTSAGFAGNFYGAILKTTDLGETWVSTTIMNGWDAKVFLLDANKGWAVDNIGYVYYTTNGGSNYTIRRISTDTLTSVTFVSSTLGYISGDSGRVFKTVNGGNNWSELPHISVNKLYSVSAPDPNNVWADGNSGTLIQSSNGGSIWTSVNATSNNLKCIYFMPSTIFGYACGDNGTIMRTMASPGNVCIGSGLNKIAYPFYTYYMDSRTDMLYLASELMNSGFTTPGNIVKVGLFVADTAFSTQTMNEFTIKMQNYPLNTINAFPETGWTEVYQSTFNVSGPGLQTFNLQTPYYWDGISNLLIEICFNNSSYTTNSFVYGTSAPGLTYHHHLDLTTGNGCSDITTGYQQNIRPNICLYKEYISGITPVNNTPQNYSLSQNYPNPFNPKTKIKYEVPKSSFVSIKVFDALGRQVAVLMNETKNPGIYIIDFDASMLSSGIYYYRMESSGYVETKKMILLK